MPFFCREHYSRQKKCPEKKQKYFLSPADFTTSAFMYEESKTPIARLKTLNLSDEPKIREFQNLPKTRLKMIFL